MTRPDEALSLYHSNFNCCQSILGAFGPYLGLEKSTALKLGAGFSGGMAFHGKTCGAVTGACLILGLSKGSDDPRNDLAEQLTYIDVKEFLKEFGEKFGSTRCRKLLNTDISTSEGYALAQETGLFKKLCPVFVEEAALILEKMLQPRQNPARSLEYFNTIASQWDTMRRTFFGTGLRDEAISRAGLTRGSVVVDLGAGSGFITEGLAGMPVRIIAIDQSPAMLEVMKIKFSGKESITYKPGSANKLPVESDSVDAVIANMYLHHVENPMKAIQEVYRILKPGGRFILADMNEHDHQFLIDEQFDIWKGFSHEKILSLMKNAGFPAPQISDLQETCCAGSNQTCDKASIIVFLAEARKGV